jgi:hypothetical protein
VVTSSSLWVKRLEPFFHGREQKKKDGSIERYAWCPVHQWDEEERNTPSAHINIERGVWHCKSQKCHEGMSSLNALWRDIKESYEDEKENAKSSKKQTKEEPLPSPTQISRWHSDLMNNANALTAFREKRGIKIETIERFNIGWRAERKRYTVPIYGANGELVDVRQYAMNTKDAGNKMISVAGHGGAYLYGYEHLSEDVPILLVEGEMDRLSGEDKGFATMTHTSGAKAWQDKWSPLFNGRTVYVCYDDDDEGRQGMLKTATSLRNHGAKVYQVHLRMPTLKRGDLTDFFVKQGMSADDFRDLMRDAETSVAGNVNRAQYPTGEARKLSVEESLAAEHSGYPIEMVGTLSGKAAAPFILPKQVDLDCDMQWGDKCNKCPLSMSSGHWEINIDPRDKVVVEMIEQSTERVERILMKKAGIPGACPRVKVFAEESYTVEEVMVVPSIEDRSEEVQNPVDRIVYSVGTHSLPINTTFKITGTNTAMPKDGRSVFHAWDFDRVDLDIDKFEMTPEIMDLLDVFQVDEWQQQTPYEKMKEVARDLSANVTKIYGRDELHMAYDLVWHSVVDFRFGGNLLGKGWLEMLVMGDTRTGKSEVAQRLAEHYQAGILKTCEGASFAGLVGGSEQKGGKSWGISWGTIPLQDRRLVILDEASGLAGKNIIEQMSAIRSMGKAQITKMGGQETSARTRLIWISNPVDGRTLEEMPHGAIDSFKALLNNPEDVARFDFAMAAASGDVQSSIINSRTHEKVPHIHTQEACQTLVTWVWSRKAEDIVISKDVEEYIFERAAVIGEQYEPDPPLIQKQNFRVKLARMAVAVAARVFSTDENGQKVIVGREHVDSALRLLDVIYGMDSFGYKDYSQRSILTRRMAERNYHAAKNFIMSNDRVWDTLKHVFQDTSFKHRDFRDFGGMVDEQASEAVNELLGFGMIKRLSKGSMKMQPPLVALVKELMIQEERELLEESD